MTSASPCPRCGTLVSESESPQGLCPRCVLDHRADIFALGVVFYELLTGELPLGSFAPPSRRIESVPRRERTRRALQANSTS